MEGKVAVVTGSNQGIGFAIVKKLCKRGVENVYVTAIEANKGEEAVEKLNKDGFNPGFHQLEITDKDSVQKFADYLKKKYGGIDMLINNAGVVNKDFLKTTYEDSVSVINTNYRGLCTIQEYFFPILKDNARVINISSDCGHISNLENTYWIQRLTKADINKEDVNAFVDWFLVSIKNGTFNENDFKGTNLLQYRVSKIVVSALTRVQQKVVDKNISVNSIHPGFVQTDFTQNRGQITADQAAQGPVYLALDIDQSVKGRYFWCDKTEKDWTDHKAELHVNRKELLDYKNKMNFYGDQNISS